MKIDIPSGVRVYNRKETREIEYIAKKIEKVFEKWCYEKITLPVFEYYNVHKRAFGKDIKDKAFKLTDRTSGDILSLRADFTAQVARYFASLKIKELPKRYYYFGRVFRYFPPKSNKLWENFQLGLELIGISRLEAEAEIISIVITSLKELNIKNFQIDINNIKIFKALKEILNLPDEEYINFMNLIKKRQKFLLDKYFKNADKELKSFVYKILENQFMFKDLKNLKLEIKDYKNLQLAIDELITIYEILEEYGVNDNIIFDLGEPREFSYYTGIIFEIFIKDFMKQIGQGGRYDDLLSKYDGEFPATGFAFNILNIWEYLKENNLLQIKAKKDFYIIDTSDNKRRAYKLAKVLREKGYSVARDILDRDYKKSLEFALKEGYKNVILIFENQNELYIYADLNNYKKVDTNTFLNGIKTNQER